MSDLLIRQGGLWFWWNRSHVVTIRDSADKFVGTLWAGTLAPKPATLDEVHEAIDTYCTENGLDRI